VTNDLCFSRKALLLLLQSVTNAIITPKQNRVVFQRIPSFSKTCLSFPCSIFCYRFFRCPLLYFRLHNLNKLRIISCETSAPPRNSFRRRRRRATANYIKLRDLLLPPCFLSLSLSLPPLSLCSHCVICQTSPASVTTLYYSPAAGCIMKQHSRFTKHP
jgi:hypothetical protein